MKTGETMQATAHPSAAVWPLITAFVVVAVTLVAAGCGGPVRRAVVGKVTLDGQPLDEAVIMFVPLEAGSRKTGARVVAGRYEVARVVGLSPGRYRVEFADDPPIDPSLRPDAVRQGLRRQLPVSYSIASPLAVEIRADGPGELDFTLTMKPTTTP